MLTQHSADPESARPVPPPRPANSPLSAKAEATLEVIFETFTPGGDLPGSSPTEINQLATARLLLPQLLFDVDLANFGKLLSLWDTRLFGLLHGIGLHRFSSLPQADREAALLRWANSRLPQRRQLFQALKNLANSTHYATPNNPVLAAIGVPTPLGPLEPAPGNRLKTEAPGNELVSVTCDVVIVGSGAGGGTAAGVLAKAGLDVVVLERGRYVDEADFGGPELEALSGWFTGAPTATVNGQIALVGGRAVGGGTVVNWTTSFATPDAVRAEWAEIGARQFSGQEYTDSLDAVTGRLGVNFAHHLPGGRDLILQRGAEQLGWPWAELPRNVAGCAGGAECGHCGLGCRIGAKQSTAKTWLADAVDHGARILSGVNVDRIDGGSANRIATVTGTTTDGAPVTIRARAVVVAAGAIETPALLKRSGFDGENIGNYLRLHPATAVFGRFAESVRPWEGALQAGISREHQDLGGNGYGVIYETGPAQPAMLQTFLPWHGSAEHRAIMRDLEHMSLIALICRDRDHGRVEIDRRGRPVARYEISEYDLAHIERGIEGSAEILFAAGAEWVQSGHQNRVRVDAGPDAVDKWAAAATRAGYAPGRFGFAALHIMGSMRMGNDPATSATNPDGALWENPNVIVADGSCFPTASGVNPMISIEAIAHMNATRLAARLNG